MADQLDAPDAQPLNPLMDPLDQPAKSWPKVVGIISIVWASLGLICSGCGAIGALVPGMFSGMMPKGQAPPPTSPMTIVLHASGFLWATVLMIAGIKTVSRSPAGRPAHLIWAAVAVPLVIVGSIIGYQIGLQQMQASLQQMQSDPKMAQQAQWMQQNMSILAGATTGCTGVISIIWPGFCLIWFGLIKRRSAEIAEGVVETAA